jgi:hypothetical protein
MFQQSRQLAGLVHLVDCMVVVIGTAGYSLPANACRDHGSSSRNQQHIATVMWEGGIAWC